MQLNIALAGLALAALAVTAGACGGDGPSIWNTAATSGDTGDTGGNSSDGSGTACQALQSCCTELQTNPSGTGASCNGEQPTDEGACEEELELFEGTGSCEDIPLPDGTEEDAGADSGPVASFGCYQPSMYTCEIVHGVTDPEADCIESGGTSDGDTCPTKDLIGCCLPSTATMAEACYYSGSGSAYSAQAITSDCEAIGGTFSSTP